MKDKKEYRKKLEQEVKELKDRNARITLQIMKMRSESNYNKTLIRGYEEELENL